MPHPQLAPTKNDRFGKEPPNCFLFELLNFFVPPPGMGSLSTLQQGAVFLHYLQAHSQESTRHLAVQVKLSISAAGAASTAQTQRDSPSPQVT